MLAEMHMVKTGVPLSSIALWLASLVAVVGVMMAVGLLLARLLRPKRR